MKDNKLYLTHILECIEKIISYTSSGENEDVLIHNYMGVNIRMVWNIVKNDLPVLKRDISKVLQSM